MEFDRNTRKFLSQVSELPALRDGEVLVRVTCCTICGSDLHTYTGRRTAPENCVLGHEIIGRIQDWGGQNPPLDYYSHPTSKGQRVTWAMAVGCGECFYCCRDLNQKCESLFKYGHESSDKQRPRGGLSDFCILVPKTPIFPIPDPLSDHVVCPANCATATVTAAMRLVRETHSITDSAAIVFGAGMLGLTATVFLREVGAKQIVVVDLNNQRLELSREFGATDVIQSSNNLQTKTIVKELTGGRGADISLEFSGATMGVQTCVDVTRTGGCVLLAGSVFPSDPVQIEPEQIVRRMLTLRGLHNYLPADLDAAIQFLVRNHQSYPFEKLVTHSFQLEETQAAFEHAAKEQPIRVCVRPTQAI